MSTLSDFAQVTAADAEIRRYSATLSGKSGHPISVSDLIVLENEDGERDKTNKGKPGIYCHVGEGGTTLRFGKTSGSDADTMTGMHNRPFSRSTMSVITEHGYDAIGIIGWCIESVGFDHPEKPLLAIEAHLACVFETPMNAGKDERTFNHRQNCDSFGADCGLRFRVG